jgi:glucose-6-phosphate dehydrogenase assembly protein OpcA
VLRAYGDTASDEEGLVTSLLLPDAPVVIWWPSNCPEVPSSSPLGRIAQRRITDAAETPDPVEALRTLGRNYMPGDTDFAWTRLTLWRAQLAAVLDQPPYEPVTGVTVSGSADSPSTELLAAWLRLQLQVPVELATTNPELTSGIHGVQLERESGVIDLTRGQDNVATLVQPNQPTHSVSLPRRNLRDCLAEELRRLDPDDLFGEVVQKGLALLDATTATSSRSPEQPPATKGPGKKGA